MTTLGAHHCHAEGCKTEVPPRKFMCKRHWYMLSKADRDRVWDLYTPFQEVTKTPSMEYLEHAQACIEKIAIREGRRG